MSNLQGSRILVVEDEDSLALGLEFNLGQEGYSVRRAADGRQALKEINEQPFDLVVLDIMLPYLDGFEVAREIRDKWPQMPILMLTARTAAKDRIKGLEIGADDYLTKPFHLQELLLRVKGMLTRKQWYQDLTGAGSLLRFGGNVVDFQTLQAETPKESFQLTPREAMLLKCLVEHQGTIVSRKYLLENVWGIQAEVETRTVDIFIARLRKYFEDDPKHPVFIRSIRGAGYQFCGDDESGH
ncbi:MAG: response regulator transcription factor [Desulfohalobiaceae bacterium]|nr:response regulator transcription factor [Desulfohalobiaceae bacterium]